MEELKIIHISIAKISNGLLITAIYKDESDQKFFAKDKKELFEFLTELSKKIDGE